MKNLSLLFSVLFALAVNAQKISQGNLKSLKDVTRYSLEFDYSNLQIPKYNSEEDFLADKMAKREAKEAGSGEKFKASWFNDRQERFEPKFIESFNKRLEDVKVDNDGSSDYIMKIHTTLMYAGYNVGVWRQNAKIDAEIYIYKKDTPNDIIAQISFEKVQGFGAFGHDYNSGYRISEAYAKLAKSFAKLLEKKAKVK